MMSLKTLARHHDDVPAFHAGYIVLTFLAAAMLPIGAFAILVFAHIGLDLGKYMHMQGRGLCESIHLSARESVIDLVLILIALVFAIYLHQSAGVIALSGLLRAEGTIVRGFGMILPKLGILSREIPVFTHTSEHLHQKGMKTKFTDREKFFVVLGTVALVLIAIAPFATSIETVLTVLEKEMVPWNF